MAEDDWIDGGEKETAALAETAAKAETERDRRKRELKIAYSRVFDKNNPDVQLVMADLMQFGRFFSSTVEPNGRAQTWPSEVLEGRRQVALRIVEHVDLPVDVLLRMYYGTN